MGPNRWLSLLLVVTTRLLRNPVVRWWRRLRGSYPEATKRATLIHELGHRLQNDLFTREEDDHPALFLWLYDVWTALYGPEFARQQVEVESARTGGRPRLPGHVGRRHGHGFIGSRDGVAGAARGASTSRR